MSDTDKVIDTAECVEIVRALVEAFAAKGEPLRRVLRDKYAPESYLLPPLVNVSTELVERGLIALGLPHPEAPTPQKIPKPTEAQARVLAGLAAHADARIKMRRGWSYGQRYYDLTQPDGGETKVVESMFKRLNDYKWIALERTDEGHRPVSYYKLTDAGREVVERYKVKAAGAPVSASN